MNIEVGMSEKDIEDDLVLIDIAPIYNTRTKNSPNPGYLI
ncbi:hypothetical protein ig2599ANME_1125 [groundwater metagenome]